MTRAGLHVQLRFIISCQDTTRLSSRSLWVILVTFDLLFIKNNCLLCLAPSCFFGPFPKASDLDTPGKKMKWNASSPCLRLCLWFGSSPESPLFKLLTSPMISKQELLLGCWVEGMHATSLSLPSVWKVLSQNLRAWIVGMFRPQPK